MTSRPQSEAEEDQAAALGCIDVLSGASALLARHKAEVKGLLPTRGSSGRGALERLMADLGEVLSTARGGTGEEQEDEEQQQQQQQQHEEQQQEYGGSSKPCSPSRRRRAKRGKGQKADAGHPQHAAPAWLSTNPDPLSIEEVLERVMSFAEGRELLGRLSRVCRLWRRVSERERLCRPVVKRYMRSALLGGKKSLHARLGGSARRCLAAYDAWQRPGRALCGGAKVEDLKYLAEMSFKGKALAGEYGGLRAESEDEAGAFLRMMPDEDTAFSFADDFSAASLGVADVHGIFTSGRLKVRYCVMDPATGVTACIINGPFRHGEALPEAVIDDGLGAAELTYSHGPMAMTSRTYSGPALRAEIKLCIEVGKPQEDDEDNLATVHLDRERRWFFSHLVDLTFDGQPGVYVEQFIRSRLAEEAEAMAANKKHGRRW